MSQRHRGYHPHRCIQVAWFQCHGERVQFASFRQFFTGNWDAAGEETCVPPSHLRVSHDQTTLRIDMSLSKLQPSGCEDARDGCGELGRWWRTGIKIGLSRNLWSFGRRSSTSVSSVFLRPLPAPVVEGFPTKRAVASGESFSLKIWGGVGLGAGGHWLVDDDVQGLSNKPCGLSRMFFAKGYRFLEMFVERRLPANIEGN